MTDREKLDDLFADGKCPAWFIDNKQRLDTVDYLIANGVTVTDNNVGCKWRPASEPPEVAGMPVLMIAVNDYGQQAVVKGFANYDCPCEFETTEKQFDLTWHSAWKVTHWMPAIELLTEVRHGYINLVNRPISAAWVTVTTEHGEKVYGKLHDKIENNPVGYCSVCSKRLDDTFMHYCPNCGAKMDGERKESK